MLEWKRDRFLRRAEKEAIVNRVGPRDVTKRLTIRTGRVEQLSHETSSLIQLNRMIKERKTRPSSDASCGFGRSEHGRASLTFWRQNVYGKWEPERNSVGENKNNREGTNAKVWGMRKFAFLPASRIIDDGKVDGDLSSPAAPSLSLFHRSLFNFFFISSGLDYFLISPNVLSTSRRVGRLPRQFRREENG